MAGIDGVAARCAKAAAQTRSAVAVGAYICFNEKPAAAARASEISIARRGSRMRNISKAVAIGIVALARHCMARHRAKVVIYGGEGVSISMK